MAKSSINFQKSNGHSLDHNFRKDKPNYLLPKEFQLENEFWKHEKSEQEIFADELSKAKRKGGRKPKLENSRWEAVLNLNKNHTLEDVKKIAKHIEKKFNIICSAIAIHRDEGFIEDERPNYNFHAHINFVTYKDGRQNWRKELIKPSTLSELQTEVAEILQMERGQINSKAERLNHRQFKQKAKELAKQKDLKAEIAKLREQLKEQGAVREQYAQLEQLNRELKEQIKAKDLSIDELQKKLKTHILWASTNAEKIRTEKDAHKETQKQLIEARETILKHEATISSQKELIERLRANISRLEHKVKELESELKCYRGKDRQEKRKDLNSTKKDLKSEKAELSSLEVHVDLDEKEREKLIKEIEEEYGISMEIADPLGLMKDKEKQPVEQISIVGKEDIKTVKADVINISESVETMVISAKDIINLAYLQKKSNQILTTLKNQTNRINSELKASENIKSQANNYDLESSAPGM